MLYTGTFQETSRSGGLIKPLDEVCLQVAEPAEAQVPASPTRPPTSAASWLEGKLHLKPICQCPDSAHMRCS